MSKSIEEQAEVIRTGSMVEEDERVEFISTGSTMVNLAGSGKGRRGGWARGRIGNAVGDGSSGKTLLVLETAAWTFYNIMKVESELFPKVKKVYIVFNNVEDVMDFPIETMYGKAFVDGVEWIRTGTIEAMSRDYARRVMALKPGEFLLYIVDSWDALTSERGKERFEKAAEKDNEEEASYGTEKAKYGSASFFSNICDISSGKDATLIIVSQIREKINAMFGKKHYRGGGKALDFYTHQVVWLAEIEKLSRVFRQEKRVYAIRSKAKFERNKVAKPFREAEFTILYDYGLDNISSMIDWYWGPKAQKIKFEDEDFSRAELIKYIEDEGLEDTLSDMCEKEWKEIENEISPKDRKKRFE